MTYTKKGSRGRNRFAFFEEQGPFIGYQK